MLGGCEAYLEVKPKPRVLGFAFCWVEPYAARMPPEIYVLGGWTLREGSSDSCSEDQRTCRVLAGVLGASSAFIGM